MKVLCTFRWLWRAQRENFELFEASFTFLLTKNRVLKTFLEHFSQDLSGLFHLRIPPLLENLGQRRGGILIDPVPDRKKKRFKP